jgi:hemerythrin-like metal-binding protein
MEPAAGLRPARANRCSVHAHLNDTAWLGRGRGLNPGGRHPNGGDMTLLWMDRLATGIEVVDEQHQNFLKIINELKETFAGREQEAIGQENRMEIYRSLLELRDYAFFHFGTEERLMVSSKYPDFIRHKTKHDDFIKKLFDMEQALLHGSLVPGSIIEYVLDWYREHIGKTDQAMGQHLKAYMQAQGRDKE